MASHEKRSSKREKSTRDSSRRETSHRNESHRAESYMSVPQKGSSHKHSQTRESPKRESPKRESPKRDIIKQERKIRHSGYVSAGEACVHCTDLAKGNNGPMRWELGNVHAIIDSPPHTTQIPDIENFTYNHVERRMNRAIIAALGETLEAKLDSPFKCSCLRGVYSRMDVGEYLPVCMLIPKNRYITVIMYNVTLSSSDHKTSFLKSTFDKVAIEIVTKDPK